MAVHLKLTQHCKSTMCCVLSHSVMSDSLQPHGLQPTRLLVHGKNTGVGCHPPLGDLPNPGIEPRCPTMQADSLPSEPPGKPMNTGLGSLCLLQGIFLTQESNQGLLHYRQILYHFRHQFSSVQSLSRVRLFKPHEPQDAMPPCPSPTPGVHSDSRPSSQ